MNLKLSAHPHLKDCSIALDNDCAVPSCYKRIMPLFKRYGLKASLNDEREFEGKIFMPLEDMMDDYHQGHLDFGWYNCKGHAWIGHETPTPCIALSEDEICSWEEAHQRHCTIFTYPCGDRSNQADFENKFWSRGYNSLNIENYDWSDESLHDFQINHQWGESKSSDEETHRNECLASGKQSFEHALKHKIPYISFMHWHWLDGFMSGVDTWSAYQEFMEFLSQRENVAYVSVAEILEYRCMSNHIDIQKTHINEYEITLSPLDNHRIDFTNLNTALSFVYTGTHAATKINGQRYELHTAWDGQRYFHIPCDELLPTKTNPLLTS
ncbi:MAG: hypothetical protein HRU15_17430 [Planctomycetes bacterium]|nr:hypothetical protein [Planctomycetota bacterium]